MKKLSEKTSKTFFFIYLFLDFSYNYPILGLYYYIYYITINKFFYSGLPIKAKVAEKSITKGKNHTNIISY